MSRLFITQREIDFISDVTKEVIKDVVGQRVFYYSVSEQKTQVHAVYGEALEKFYNAPIAVDALVSNVFQSDTSISQFGVDTKYKIEVYAQYRDLVEKGININVGDFFSYGNVFYEITEVNFIRGIYGQIEHKDGIRIIGTKSRDGQFKVPFHGPTDISHTDPDAVQTEFVQQRGFVENAAGPTGDKRALIENGKVDEPLTGPKIINGSGVSDSSFYSDE